jgi:hypothetical protein
MQPKRHGKIKTLDDIQRERSIAEREETKERIVTDVRDVMSRFSPKPRKPRLRTYIMWGIGIILLLLILANFILFNVWAFRELVKALFFG